MTTTTTAVAEASTWTQEAVRALGMTTDVEIAGEILGIGRTKAYELAKNGDFPAKIVRIGRRYKVSVPAAEDDLRRRAPGLMGFYDQHRDDGLPVPSPTRSTFDTCDAVIS